MKFVTYLRVSTDRQGRSGLGLEAQQAAVQVYAEGRGKVVAEFIEVESGRKADRPQLASALSKAKRLGAVLLIAKLDRLSRSVTFISKLMDSKVQLIVADMPDASPFMLHILAAVAEQEAVSTSQRTRAALEAAKARGVALGWSMPSRRGEQRSASQKGAAANRRLADDRALNVLPLIQRLSSGGMSLRQIAEELNIRGTKTARGGRWHASTVRNLMSRKMAVEFDRQASGYTGTKTAEMGTPEPSAASTGPIHSQHGLSADSLEQTSSAKTKDLSFSELVGTIKEADQPEYVDFGPPVGRKRDFWSWSGAFLLRSFSNFSPG